MRGTLRKRSQFQVVYEMGSKAVGRLCVVYAYQPANSECVRVGEDAVGVVASKKVGNAVARSRAKRRLREAYRCLHDRVQRPRWVVLVARNALVAKNLSHDRIVAEMETLFQELGAFTPSSADARGDATPC